MRDTLPRFNLTLEMLIVDRPFWNASEDSDSPRFNLTLEMLIVDRQPTAERLLFRNPVSISHLRCLSLIAIRPSRISEASLCCFNLTLEMLIVDRMPDNINNSVGDLILVSISHLRCLSLIDPSDR